MSYRRRERRRSGGRGCLVGLVSLVWIVLIVLLAYRFFLRPQVSAFVGDQIAQQLEQTNTANGQIEDAAGNAIPGVVAALPSGELRVDEARVNAFLATRQESLAPLESAQVRFGDGTLAADLMAFGTTSTLQLGLVAQNGQLVAVDPQLDGPLGQFISADTLLQSIQNQLNSQLSLQGRRITDARIEPGNLILTVE